MRSASFDRSETLEKIMNAFWEHGYEATSIQVLEAATGLKRQSLYNAFGNKDAMFELASERYHHAVSEKLMARLDQEDPKAALRDFFAVQLEVLVDENQPAGCFVAGGQQELANRDESALGQRMVGLIGVQFDALVSAFTRWQDAGRLTDDADPEALAAIVMSQLRGQSVLGRSPVSRPIITKTAETLPSLLDRYLA